MNVIGENLASFFIFRLWRNWTAGRCVIRTFIGHSQGISCVQFDSNRIVSGSSDSTIRIWDIKTNVGSVGSMTLTGHSGTVRCLHLDRNRLASGIDIEKLIEYLYTAPQNYTATQNFRVW